MSLPPLTSNHCRVIVYLSPQPQGLCSSRPPGDSARSLPAPHLHLNLDVVTKGDKRSFYYLCHFAQFPSLSIFSFLFFFYLSGRHHLYASPLPCSSWWAPSFCSPSSHSRAPIFLIGELLHASCALFFSAAAWGMSLDGLALVARVLHS